MARRKQSELGDVATRDRILNSARKYFLEYGFQAAPLRKIAKDAGFTSGALYGYFDSKEALFYSITCLLYTSCGCSPTRRPPANMFWCPCCCAACSLPTSFPCPRWPEAPNHRENGAVIMRERWMLWTGASLCCGRLLRSCFCGWEGCGCDTDGKRLLSLCGL